MSSIFYSKRLFELKRFRGPRVRPKTFKTEEAAKNYAEKMGIKKFTVEQNGKKFTIVQ